MCEINPKRKQFYRLEFFTAHPISQEEWDALVTTRLIVLEGAFNMEGKIRVHIHEEVTNASQEGQEQENG
jgi:hypothetical protein